MATDPRRLPAPWSLACLAAALLAGAVLVSCVVAVPQNGWNPDQGPVVPHDRFPADCSLCHVTSDWVTLRKDFRFDHAKETGYRLAGAHATAQCLRCHNDRGPVQSFMAKGCGGCHVDPHEGHLGRNCTDCHEEGSGTWQPREMIERHNRTRFPLIGAHAATACFACHPGYEVGNFQRTDVACESCHRGDLVRAVQPPHATLGLNKDCERCHVPTTWHQARFDHSFFPLTGHHAALRCAACHPTGVYRGTPRDCAGCHQGDYDRTRNPNHGAAGFPTTCDSCHNTSSWSGARFAEHDRVFPLTGVHLVTPCASCHPNGRYQGTPRDCVGCHQANYDATRNPDHRAASFSLQCETCHATSGWRPATFADHDRIFALTGAHRVTSCASCHPNGRFGGTPRDCAGCHQANYDRTTRPNHRQLGYPTTCDTCHTTDRWTGARFNHSFPITSGPHAGRSCNDCHLQAGNWQSFSCTHCHEHAQATMDSKHRDVRNYTWSSPACLQCHPQGRH